MQPSPPSEAELEELLAEYATRFPEKYKITVRGDHGAAVSLPLLLVNPTPSSDGWADFLRMCMKLVDRPVDLDERLAAQCIAWPPPKQWALWLQRWPSLAFKVASALMLKTASNGTAVSDPTPSECAPAPLAHILDEHPRAVWVKVQPPSESYVFVVEPPAPAVWRIFKKSIAVEGADVVKLAHEFACACVIGSVGSHSGEGSEPMTYTPEPHVPLLERWPGLSGHIVAEVGSLTGASGEVTLGGW